MYLSAAGSIEKWLLHSGIQIESGAEAGAIAGWLTEGGAPAFAYPEITGYYLTCMAFVGCHSPAARSPARQRAGKSADWLARQALAPGPPPTRRYLDPQNGNDWRNAAVFAFDLAMVTRGLAHACRFAPSPSWRPLLEQYLAYLLDLCTAEGMLRPAQLREGHDAHQLPSTWSTAEGAHHVKTAAALLSVPESLLPARLAAAAHRLAGRWVGEPWSQLRTLPLHPLLYYIEGLVLLAVAESDPGKLADAATVYAAAMQAQDEHGCLPSVVGAQPAVVRSDVMAQALRIGSLLKTLGYLPGGGWEARLEALARALLGFIGAGGAVSQYPLRSGPALQWNAWCSMFAYQAFVFYGSLVECKAATIPGHYFEYLI